LLLLQNCLESLSEALSPPKEKDKTAQQEKPAAAPVPTVASKLWIVFSQYHAKVASQLNPSPVKTVLAALDRSSNISSTFGLTATQGSQLLTRSNVWGLYNNSFFASLYAEQYVHLVMSSPQSSSHDSTLALAMLAGQRHADKRKRAELLDCALARFPCGDAVHLHLLAALLRFDDCILRRHLAGAHALLQGLMARCPAPTDNFQLFADAHFAAARLALARGLHEESLGLAQALLQLSRQRRDAPVQAKLQLFIARIYMVSGGEGGRGGGRRRVGKKVCMGGGRGERGCSKLCGANL
jgi:hypothetical protein